MGLLYLGGPTIQEVDGKMMIGLSIYGVAVISGSLYSRFYGTALISGITVAALHGVMCKSTMPSSGCSCSHAQLWLQLFPCPALAATVRL